MEFFFRFDGDTMFVMGEGGCAGGGGGILPSSLVSELTRTPVYKVGET